MVINSLRLIIWRYIYCYFWNGYYSSILLDRIPFNCTVVFRRPNNFNILHHIVFLRKGRLVWLQNLVAISFWFFLPLADFIAIIFEIILIPSFIIGFPIQIVLNVAALYLFIWALEGQRWYTINLNNSYQFFML